MNFDLQHFYSVACDRRPILFLSQMQPDSRQHFSTPKVVDIFDAAKSQYFSRNSTRTFINDFE